MLRVRVNDEEARGCQQTTGDVDERRARQGALVHGARASVNDD